MKFLGHVISQNGVVVDLSKAEAVLKSEQPTKVTKIQSFLGWAGYYRRFIDGFSHIALPMTKLTKKGEPFEWSDKCEHSFNLLKEKLATTPVLVIPDLTMSF